MLEAVTDFFFLGSKITADSDCSHEFRRQLLLGRKKWKWKSLSLLTLCDPMECLLHPWDFQARILEWVAVSFSRGSSWPTDWTQVFHIAGRRFTVWATMTNLDSVLKTRDITLPTKVHIVKAWSSQWSGTVARVGLKRRQNVKELMPSKCGAREDYRESLGQQGDQTRQS